MRKIEWDEHGPLVYLKRYKPSKKLQHNPGYVQRQDGRIIQLAAARAGLTDYIYESEWTDYIEDFEGPLTIHKTFRKQLVSFDHVLFVNDTVIIFESDDRSHYDADYCQKNDWDYDSIQRRDKIKNVWAQRTNTLLIRIPEHHLTNGKIGLVITPEEKMKVLIQIFKNIKDVTNCV